MNIKNLILCGALGLAMVSCSTKQNAINQLEDFSYELRDHSRYYDADEWEKAGKKFVNIRKKISKHEFDYTPEEKAKTIEGKKGIITNNVADDRGGGICNREGGTRRQHYC